MFSPDGRWIAYTSDESGGAEVYLRPYPGPGGRTIVSTDGGADPLWAKTGRELFYREGDKVLVVDVQTEPEFTLGTPKLLFRGNYAQGREHDVAHNYDVSADGQRFLMVKPTPVQSQPITRLHVVTNWFEELKAKTGTK
jgi:serine/threonine-protein kinase